MALNNSNRLIIIWLFSGVMLIMLMVIVGGITRLTGSGLSITEWNPIMGAIPPLNETAWNEAFEKYKQIPQYKLENTHFSVSDFKFIFFWEWLHRLIGRVLGVVFIIPYLFFLWKKKIPSELHPKLIIVFLLGGFQGFLGWFMVKSGLSELTSVSHFRLAAHLITAFITCGYIIWIIFEILNSKKSLLVIQKQAVVLSKVTFILVLLQIIFGAFVAGLDGGFGYNTWPLMNGKWFNTESFSNQKSFLYQLFNQKYGVQIIHRYFAYVVLIFGVILGIAISKYTADNQVIKYSRYIAIAIFLQFLLGILTILVLPHNPVLIGTMHQLGSFFVFCIFVIYLQLISYRNPRKVRF
ncbi:MAG: COX15/CtaA family protein [Bacteroidia bacterium]|nr:COX15/CtaA family protein [Bacteroidia bacterium]